MKKETILIIHICKEKLHYYEFVKPIKDILFENNIDCYVKDYKNVSKSDLINARRVIICGTSLFDNYFTRDYHIFDWLLDYDKPVLGICGGMQIIGLVFGNKYRTFNKGLFRKKTEIGYFVETFKNDFLGLSGKQQVYHLHNYYVKFLSEDFDFFTDGNIAQAVKHKDKEIYGCLFHPEVRNKELIAHFCTKVY